MLNKLNIYLRKIIWINKENIEIICPLCGSRDTKIIDIELDDFFSEDIKIKHYTCYNCNKIFIKSFIKV